MNTHPDIQRRIDLVALHKAYTQYMYYEAADRGYDFKAANKASVDYSDARIAYNKKYDGAASADLARMQKELDERYFAKCKIAATL